MEEAEKSLESKENRLKNGTDPPEGAVKIVSTETKNGDGNKMEEVKNYEDENNSSEEFKEARNAQDGEEKEDGDSQGTEEKKNLEKTKDKEKKKESEVQNGNEMKFVVEGKDEEVNGLLERVEDARDKKSAEAVEDLKFNNEKYGLGDVEAIGGESKQEGSNPIDDISAKEMRNGKNEGVDEMKDHEHGKPTSSEKGEDSILVQVEENDGGKARKEAKDTEMVGTDDVAEKEDPDVKDEGKLVVSEEEEEKAESGGNAEKTVGEKAKPLKRKRSKVRTRSEIGEAKKNGDTKEIVEEMDVKGSRKRSKEVLSSPVVSSSDRPVRERKTVERLVEVIDKGPDSTVIIEKGRGAPLREIPNVAYNLARKKPAELKLLHQTLFGRKGKAVDYKSNILQFSGFAWHESEEKQRAKIKEKLDKCVKETLLELCDLFDLTVSRTNTKKDEIIVKVLDFLEAPQAMSDAVHAEKQSSKSRKRERAPKVDASKSSGGNSNKRSRLKHDKADVGTPNSDVKSSQDTKKDDEEKDSEEDEDSEEHSHKEDEVRSHSESDPEKELEETGNEDESKDDTSLTKGKQVKKSPKEKKKQDVKKSPKKQAFSDTVKRKIGSNSKKTSPKTDGKSSLKTPPSKHPKDEKSNDTGEKAFSRNKKDAESLKKSNSKSNSKEKSSGKASKSKSKSGKVQKSGPTNAELRKSILEILKEADFNTATFTDILKQLASEYKIDLTPRKAAIKLMIHQELTKMAAEDEESQDEEEMQ